MIPEITIRLPIPSPDDIQNNRQACTAAFRQFGQVRLRVALSVYAPGTKSNPKARYFDLLNTSMTIICTSPQALNYALTELQELASKMNGWTPDRDRRPTVIVREEVEVGDE